MFTLCFYVHFCAYDKIEVDKTRVIETHYAQEVYSMPQLRMKPCPNCGNEAGLYGGYSQKVRAFAVYVRCRKCKLTGRVHYSLEDPAEDYIWKNDACIDAIDSWNRGVYEERGQA